MIDELAMKKISDIEYIEKIRKFGQLDRKFLKYMYEFQKPHNKQELDIFFKQAVELALESYEKFREIEVHFYDFSNLIVHDPTIIKILDQIRDKEKFYSVSFCEEIVKLNRKRDNKFEELDITITLHDYLSLQFDDIFDEFNTWFSVIDYYYSKIKIGPIISSNHIPPNIIVYFNELRETFAFYQYRASIIMCRAILEMALFDSLLRKKIITKNVPKVTPIDISREDKLHSFIRIARKNNILDKRHADIAHKIRQTANNTLHLKDHHPVQVTENETLEVILNTVAVVEKIYRT